MQVLLVILGASLAFAGVVALFVLKSRMAADRKRMEDLVFLQLLVPKKESREEKDDQSDQFGKDFREVIGVMDHLYQSLHSLYNGGPDRHLHGQQFFSLEYAALAGEILFFVVCPRRLAGLVEKQITSFYPDCIMSEVEDYNIFTPQSVAEAKTLMPSQPWTSVFKTYQSQKSDPLNSITNAFSKLKSDEGAAVQIVLRPAKSGWQKDLQDEAT